MELGRERQKQGERLKEKLPLLYHQLAMSSGSQEEAHSDAAHRLEEQCSLSSIRYLNKLNYPSGDYMEAKYIKIGKQEETHFCLDEVLPTFC